jgi:peptidoglycan/LPS O-acetylase OafA/YrhL
MKYRPDIDGLRALGVLAVLLYHADVTRVSGGYVGVDIFFFVSGFLITALVQRSVEQGTFSYGQFYARRARRLLPASLVTLGVTALVAMRLLAPDHLKSFGASLVMSAVSLSNVHFWTQSGYFDADAILKPLLHTWSLGVEEQFYLIWPAFIVLVARRRERWGMPLAMVTAGALSLGACLYVMRDDVPAAFFLTPLRGWEFCVGGLAVWAQRRTLPAYAQEGLTVVGI